MSRGRAVAKAKKNQGLEMVRKYSLNYYGRIIDAFETLGRYLPGPMMNWIELRQSIFSDSRGEGLTIREKELVATAIEIISRKPDSGPHAKLAIKAGATPKDVADVCAICILLGGMVAHMTSGQHALKAAEEEYERQKKSRARPRRQP